MTTGTAEVLAGRLRQALQAELPAAHDLRRYVHEHPRLSGFEADTTAVVVEALGAGEGTPAAGAGRVVVLGADDDATAGCVALRAELDALPVTEATGVPWSATGRVMHACGHDVHLAATVAACRAIARVGGAPLPVAALLQPHEETPPSGARDIMASGLLGTLDVRAVIGAHVQPHLPDGTIAVTPGLVNASVDEFEITVHGAGGHAGYPHTVRDPVVALASVVVNLQQIAARRIDPVHGAVCVVGEISGGTAANVVPSIAHARGSLRLMRPEDRERARVEVAEIAQASAAAYGCRAEVRVLDGEPALCNDLALAELAARVLREQGYRVVDDFRSFGADDFAHYTERIPSLMAFVGVGGGVEGGVGGGVGLHDPRFLPPDSAVAAVAEALLAGYVAAAGRL